MKRLTAHVVGLLLVSGMLFPFVVNKSMTDLHQHAVPFPEGLIPSASEDLNLIDYSLVSNYTAYLRFESLYGKGWSIFIEPNAGKPSYIGGQGIPMIPGHGNTLTMADIDLSTPGPRRSPTLEDVNGLVRAFIAQHVDLLGLVDGDLRLMPGSGFYGEGDYLCFLNYQIMFQGVPVEGAVFQVRINNGNLVDMGFTGAYAAPLISATPALTAADALGVLGAHIGGWTPQDVVTNSGTLKIIPYYLGPERPFGQRVGHRLVWDFEFHRTGLTQVWHAWIEAQEGRVLKFEDATAYATYKRIHGQVYPEHVGGGQALADRSFAFTRENTNAVLTSIGGLYSYPSGTVTCNLNFISNNNGYGYASTNEQCTPAVSLSSATGDLDFGGTTAQDCNAPKANGNATEAGLMGLYHLTIQKVTALTYLPANTWLGNSLEFEANYDSTCNANWDGTDLTMYRSDGPSMCNNSGLISGIFLHEFGHGLDANDGLAPADYGSGENYGDACGMIQTHNSCIGDYFYSTARTCGGGYGNACLDCGGVRDVNWDAKTRHTPSTPQNYICTDCTASAGYPDPCGYEGHCTAAGMGEALYDLPVRDLPGVSGMDAATAWERFAKIFYLSRPTSGGFYSCTTAGSCSAWTSNGCASANWYRTLRVMDDDNGNLCDGTPNAAAIYAAFNRHNIACPPTGPCPNENTNNSGCPTLTAPTLAVPTAGACQIGLSWSAVTNATQYFVFRNEFGCDKNFIKIATVAGAQLTYLDTDVSPGITYYYTIQAGTTNAACTGSMSTCRSGVPTDCLTCTIPNAPTGVGCAGGSNQIVVTWTAPGGTHDGYRVYRQKSGEFTWTNVSGNLGLVTTYTDTNLICATDYRYKVVSFENTGGPCESADSNISGYCQGACGGCTAPGAPTLNSATGTCTGVDLAWTAGTGTTLSYNIYRKAAPCGGTFTKIAGPIVGLTYSDGTAVAGTNYAYLVRGACDAGGATESGNSNCLTGTRLAAPAAPTGVTASNNRCTDVQVAWSAVTGATSYNVLRGTTCGTILNTFTGVTSPYNDVSAVAGTNYQYWVVALNACGTSGNSSCAAGVRLGVTAAPTGVAATSNRCDDVQVTWNNVTGATSYNVLRGTVCGTVVTTFTGVTSPYNDTSAVPGTNYQYWVVAVNVCGNSANSSCAAGTRLVTPAAPGAPTFTNITCSSLRVNWTAVPGTTAYVIWRATGASCSGAASLGGTNALYWDDSSGLSASTQYSYYIVAWNVATCFSPNGTCAQVTTPACAGPKPVPDGRLSGAAMTGAKVTPGSDGTNLTVIYDTASCTQADHSILYGLLTALNPITPSGGVCSIGNTSPYAWNGSPAGNIWWVIVGDGGTTESSWGQKMVGGAYSQRSASASNQCGNTAIDVTGTCP